MKVQVVHKKQEDGSTTHHARIRGDNGEIVWVTETYERSAGAWGAVDVLQSAVHGDHERGHGIGHGAGQRRGRDAAGCRGSLGGLGVRGLAAAGDRGGGGAEGYAEAEADPAAR